MGRYTKLRRNLLDLCALNHALAFDTQMALKGLGRACRHYAKELNDGKEAAPFELCFWNRIAVRALFAQIEGLSYFMRRTVTRPRHARALEIPRKKQAELLELRYDRDSDKITKSLAANRVADNIKLAFRFYPKIFGFEYELNTNSPSWKALIKILVPSRNGMTHGGTFEDFYSVEAAQVLKPCLVWFLASMGEMLASCCEEVEISVPAEDFRVTLKEHEFDESSFNQVTLPKDQFLGEVAKYQGRSLALLQESMSLFGRENAKAIEYFTQLNRMSSLDASATQFALRNWIRTMVTYVEGCTYLLRLYTEQAAERDEIKLTEQQKASLYYIDVFDRSDATAKVFAEKFGANGSFQAKEEYWSAVRTVLEYRDRLTHPKSIQDMSFTQPDILGVVANCLGWQAGLLGLLELDADKLVQQGRSSGSILPSDPEVLK